MTALPDWLSEADRRFFEFAASELTQFAAAHDLRTEPWFKDVPLWALHFRHPLGGVGQIVVGPKGGEASLTASWWRDDFASETRYLTRELGPVQAPATEAAFKSALEDVYRSVRSLKEDALLPHKMPKGTWHKHFSPQTFSEWERSLPKGRT